MTKFIIHGGFARRENESNKNFYRELVKDVTEGGSILMIFFSSREQDPTVTFEELKRKISDESEDKSLSFVYATKEDLIEQIKNVDAVYINGGSTNKLLNILRSYQNLSPLLEGKTIAGSSAGAYAIAKLGASHSEDSMREGLGLAPLRVVCHYESLELPPAKGSVQRLLNSSLEYELVLLRDCEWKVFTY